MTVSLNKAAPVVAVEFPAPTQYQILGDLVTGLASTAWMDEKVFSSNNIGLYSSRTLKAPEARELGITVPVGGTVKLTIQAVVTDPANRKDA